MSRTRCGSINPVPTCREAIERLVKNLPRSLDLEEVTLTAYRLPTEHWGGRFEVKEYNLTETGGEGDMNEGLKPGDILIATTLCAFENHRFLIIDDDDRWTLYRPDGSVGSRGKHIILKQLESGFYRKANFTLSDVFKSRQELDKVLVAADKEGYY